MDNSISGYSEGIHFVEDPTLYPGGYATDYLSNNSIYAVFSGIQTQVDPTNTAIQPMAASGTFLGATFSDNLISEIWANGNGQALAPAGIILANNVNAGNPYNVLLNILNGNRVTDAETGAAIFDAFGGTETDSGFADTILCGNFFASDGAVSSSGVYADSVDTSSYIELGDTSQGFWS